MAAASSPDTLIQVEPLVVLALDRLASTQSGANSPSYVALVSLIPPGVRAVVDTELREVKLSFIPPIKNQMNALFSSEIRRPPAAADAILEEETVLVRLHLLPRLHRVLHRLLLRHL
jgi:hypothetical protein